MFQELMPLLSQRRLLLMISRVNIETICVNLIPQPLKENEQDANPALSIPLSLTGTPQELDLELPAQLVEFVGAHLTLSSTLRSAKEELANATKAARAAAKKTPGAKTSQVTSPPTPSPAPALEAKEADSEREDGAGAAAIASTPSATGNLFASTTT